MNFISADQFPDTQPRQRDIAAVVCLSPSERLRRLRFLDLYQRQSVECVMSMFSDCVSASRSVAAMERMRENLRPVQAREENQQREAAPSLSTIQTVALLNMIAPKDEGSALCRSVAAHLQKEIQDRPNFRGYCALADLGLCALPEGERWHQLTAKGQIFAQRIARDLARSLGIHVLIEGGASGSSISFHCACGQWARGFYRSSNGRSAAYVAWARHACEENETPLQPRAEST